MDKVAKWKAVVAEVAAKYPEIPAGLLDSVAQQESGYQERYVSGKEKSSAGAIGLMQWMPASAKDYDVDPLDPRSAADGAARYLIDLKRQFGSWAGALTAYNWGPGNLGKFLSGKRKDIPNEAEKYAREVMARVGTADMVAAPPTQQSQNIKPVEPPTVELPQPEVATLPQPEVAAIESDTASALPQPATFDINEALPIDDGVNIAAVVPENNKDRGLLDALRPEESGLAKNMPGLVKLANSLKSPKPLLPIVTDNIDELLLDIVRRV